MRGKPRAGFGRVLPARTVTSEAVFNGQAEWQAGDLDVFNAPLTIGGRFQQDAGSIVAMSNETAQSDIGVTIAGSYYLCSGASLTISNASLTVAGGAVFEAIDSSSAAGTSVVAITASPVIVDCNGTFDLDDSQITVSDGSAVNFGTTGNVGAGAAIVTVGGSDGAPADLLIAGSSSLPIDLGFCDLAFDGDGLLSTARSIVETAADPNYGGQVDFNGGTLQAAGDNSNWLYAATNAAALTVDGATVDTHGCDVTISAALAATTV